MSESPPELDYSAGENVLCYHGPLVYAAKILKTQTDGKNTLTGYDGPSYFVHYKGWKTGWDEWVVPARLLKDNERNRAHQKSLLKGAPPRAIPKASIATGAATSVSARGKGKEAASKGTKRPRDESGIEMKLNIPEQIKAKLVKDCEMVTKQEKLVSLPRAPNVDELLKEFEAYLVEIKPPHLRDPEKLAPTVASGILVYFDRSLANHLLYRAERLQYNNVRAKYITGQKVIIGSEKEMSEVYGAEHLLRLLVTLPTMIAQSVLDSESTDIVREYVDELLAWMLQEQSRIFQPEYVDAVVGQIIP
ncbi:MRG-domain-containing protein [Mycena crocata]|nr:MRG-domain-containing protein [Mycena crocata]